MESASPTRVPLAGTVTTYTLSYPVSQNVGWLLCAAPPSGAIASSVAIPETSIDLRMGEGTAPTRFVNQSSTPRAVCPC